MILYVLLIGATVLYLLIIAALFIFGLNFFYLTFLAWREDRRERQKDAKTSQDAAQFAWPRVTVQLPIYNELYVAERVIQAAARLDYPSSLLQIQVLDDSTDETAEIINQTVMSLQAQGVNIQQLHRTDRTGFKAGALQAGLAQATGEFIAFFDADFVPQPDFLQRTLPRFDHPRVAFVQTRWGHLNRRYSVLTYLQSLAIDAHFMVEQFARSRGGYWFNFNGTAGVWRREALLDAGGWKADTLTEDLDLSYRVYLRGWQGRYAPDVVAPAELPVSISAFRRQQHRWARGSLECAFKLGPQVLRADVPRRIKLQASLHLLGYTVHLLLFALTLLYPAMLIVFDYLMHRGAPFSLGYVLNITALAPTLFFVMGQRQLRRGWWQQLPAILSVSAVGSGMMVNTVRAAWQIIARRHDVFERTAKFGLGQHRQAWTQQRYQLQLDAIVVPEFLLGLYAAVTAWLAFQFGNWAIAVYAILFGSGLLFVASLTIVQAIAIFRSQQTQKSLNHFEQSPAMGETEGMEVGD